MKQILQDLRSGQTRLVEVPAPICRPGTLLIRTTRTLISAGTERMLVEFGKASLLAKARSQPDKVRQVLDKIHTDGLRPTMEAVFNRLDEPLPLGYCSAGVVLEVGRGVEGFSAGDRVASNGSHAEIVCVPKHLCAKIPDTVSDEQAAFTVLSSIALQGVRLADPGLGENVVVFGLGLIGLVTAQLLTATGCRVLGIDVSPDRLRLARQLGIQAVRSDAAEASAAAWTDGKGIDAVLITASAKTDAIVHQAAQMCRQRGRIVLVGVVGLDLRRDDFYQKELTFQVSCSYGPGRYDDAYETGGRDYPCQHVRWTEQRNFQAVLQTMAAGSLRVEALISHRFELVNAPQAYEHISDRGGLGVVLKYPSAPDRATVLSLVEPSKSSSGPTVALIGAGNFSKMTLLPALAKTPARIAHIADLNAAAAVHLGRKFGALSAVTEYHVLLEDPQVEAVMIAVNHNLHARLVTECLAAGKHAFVEKPLAMTPEDLCAIVAAAARSPDRTITVGFNRRFSPHVRKITSLLAGRREPLAMNMMVNAGTIPPGHWVHDPVLGGGRIIGEACHFIDLLSYLAGSPVVSVSAQQAARGFAVTEDKMSISLAFEDGSVGSVCYFANGSKAYPKEQLTLYSDGRALHLNNFRETVGRGFESFTSFRTRRQDKGHTAQFAAYVEGLGSGTLPLMALSELVNVTRASFAAMTSAREHRTIIIDRE